MLILCILKTAPGQSRTASLALGTVVPASLGKEASTCQLYPGDSIWGRRLKMETSANAVQHPVPNMEGL